MCKTIKVYFAEENNKTLGNPVFLVNPISLHFRKNKNRKSIFHHHLVCHFFSNTLIHHLVFHFHFHHHLSSCPTLSLSLSPSSSIYFSPTSIFLASSPCFQVKALFGAECSTLLHYISVFSGCWKFR